MDNIDNLLSIANNTFGKTDTLMSLMQEIADNFYPERADFTLTRSLGTDFASNLTSSVPLLARRDMGDMFSSMLRPSDVYWFKIGTSRQQELNHEAKLWLDNASKTQWNAMYDRKAMFKRATKEGDHDYAAFGQCALSKELNYNTDTLIYRCHHLRDVRWLEDGNGEPCPIFRKWSPDAYTLNKEFRGNVSRTIKDMLRDPKRKFETVKVMHMVVPADMVEKKYRTPYVSLFVECESKHVLRVEGSWTKIYTIPRWQTVSGSQYAYSPATIAALPDARLFQQMTLVLLEAGEKAVNPPIIATQDVVRSDVNQFAGGITWVDSEYDERLGAALAPMTINSNGIPHGMNMREEIKRVIESSFYLDKIGLPVMNGDMTAFETAQRVKEYMRRIVPLFSPIEDDYNASLCEDTFDILLRGGAFGAQQDIPEQLSGEDIRFQFRSPISETLDRQKAQSFQEAKAMLAESAALDPSAPKMFEIRRALRDTLEGIGVPQAWLRSEEDLAEMDKQQAQTEQLQQSMAMMQQGGEAAKVMGEAANQFNQAGAMAQ